MTETKSFPTLAVVSASTGILVCELYDMYDVIDWMLDDSLMTHQYPNGSRTIWPYLEAQHPWLADLDLPAGNIGELVRITKEILDEHGGTMLLERPKNPDWIQHNGLVDMMQLANGRPVIPVTVPDTDELAATASMVSDVLFQITASTEQLDNSLQKLIDGLTEDDK